MPGSAQTLWVVQPGLRSSAYCRWDNEGDTRKGPAFHLSLSTPSHVCIQGAAWGRRAQMCEECGEVRSGVWAGRDIEREV